MQAGQHWTDSKPLLNELSRVGGILPRASGLPELSRKDRCEYPITLPYSDHAESYTASSTAASVYFADTHPSQ